MVYLMIIAVMIIWGSISLFVKGIPLESSQIVMFRTLLGSITLVFFSLGLKRKINYYELKKQLGYFVVSGVSMAVNWMLLFEAYNYTSVSVATLTYYCAPAIIILLSPVVLKEKLTYQKLISIIGAMVGMILISGNYTITTTDIHGILLAFLSAIFYAIVVLSNKKINNFSGFDIALIELVIAAIIITPNVLLTTDLSFINFSMTNTMNLIIIGIIHTGLAFALYFSAMTKMSAQTVAILGFVDPVAALVLSFLVLNEKMIPIQIFGAVIMIGSAIFAETVQSKNKKESVNQIQ